MKSFAGLALMVLLAVNCGAARAQEHLAPDALVKKTTDEIVAHIRKDKSLVSNSRKLLEMVDTVVLPHFNFTRMTMLAVGRPWQSATESQREQLVQQFRTLLVRTYSGALAQVKDQTVELKPMRSKPEDSEVIVRTEVRG